MRRRLFMSMALLVMMGCATQHSSSIEAFKPDIAGAQEKRDLLVGSWYGETTLTNGEKRRWVNRRSSDGTYIVESRTGSATDGRINREYGVWGVSGPIYFTMMRGWMDPGGELFPSDPGDANFYDAYQILELTSDSLRYRGLETGNTFSVRRVANDFSL